MKSVDHKVHGGKLLRVDIEKDRVIKRIRISGDFFMHPEEAIDDIERILTGLPVDQAKAALDKYIKDNDVKLIGIKVSDIIAAMGG